MNAQTRDVEMDFSAVFCNQKDIGWLIADPVRIPELIVDIRPLVRQVDDDELRFEDEALYIVHNDLGIGVIVGSHRTKAYLRASICDGFESTPGLARSALR
jgi:hypothetical protein